MRNAVIISLALTLALVACERNEPTPAQTTTGSSASARPTSRVAKIVFINMESACACTQRRTEQTWAAMQTALGTPASAAARSATGVGPYV
ncbi:MAG: hypothetical protein HY744_07305 [Deltaproteobacteria bacterium]|nr:hypothetical protein [Deltaproteobacteria bacterium]